MEANQVERLNLRRPAKERGSAKWKVQPIEAGQGKDLARLG